MDGFGAVAWLPFAILGLVLSIGYLVMRGMQRRTNRGAKKDRRERQSQLDRELQAEIDATVARKAGSASTPVKTGEEQALEPPKEEKARLDELKQQIEATRREE